MEVLKFFIASMLLFILLICTPQIQSNNTLTKISEVNSEIKSIIDIKIEKQSALNLCWASVASGISQFYEKDKYWSQCKLTDKAFGLTNCCKDLNACDRAWYLDSALIFTRNYRQAKLGMPSFDEIKNEILNGHVISLRIEWRAENQGHFILITGFYDGEFVQIEDPWPT